MPDADWPRPGRPGADRAARWHYGADGPGHAPGKSGALLERVVIGGQPYVLKHLDLAPTGRCGPRGACGPASRAVGAWHLGAAARLHQPADRCCARKSAAARLGCCTLVMRDVGPGWSPPPTGRSPPGQHPGFLPHMAALHAAFWDCGADCEVVPAMHRYLELSPWMARLRRLRRTAAGAAARGQGLAAVAEVAPEGSRRGNPAGLRPGPLVAALSSTPHTFVHGNWKLDNLGTDDAGRTVVLDWEQPGLGAPLPIWPGTSRSTPAACHSRRRNRSPPIATPWRQLGIDTEPWWDRQLALSLLGALVQFGWEKALGGYDEELAWWEAKALAAAALLS